MKKKSTSQSVPARRTPGEGGFFNLRVVIGVFLVLASALLALLGFGTFSNASAQVNSVSPNLAEQTQEAGGQQAGQTTVICALHADLSLPLRDQPLEWPEAGKELEPPLNPKIPIQHHDSADPVIQGDFSQSLMSPSIPNPIHQWSGIHRPCNACSFPPDTNGAVGKTQYVEVASIDALQVFDKITGTSLLGPISMSALWSGFGGPCEANPSGDPVVFYDQLADRWIISQFATPTGAVNPQDECIAISQTGDARGAWYRYHFHLTSGFVDYMKFGVWPDGYYMSANMFAASGEPFLGPQAFVFDRAKMLVGDPTARAQTRGIIGGPNEPTFLPSYLDGFRPPPMGDPNHFVAFPQEENVRREGGQSETLDVTRQSALSSPTPAPLIYRVWDYHVDWDNPANSSFTLKASVPAAAFARVCPTANNCVPELGLPQTDWLNALDDRLMFRNAYRRFPDGHESMLNNFTVRAPIRDDPVAAIRWFELRRMPSGNWALRQESTYRPDSTWRWLGSIASDNQGNIALGFNASSNTIFPQIRYAGRLATDPLNVLSGERHLHDGTGSQEDTENRWGDYSDMTVDPVDDCTFYYTNEYYGVTERAAWRTRIGYFRFAQCTSPQKGTGQFVVAACNGGAPIHNALVSIDNRPYGATLINGTYDAVLAPGSHSYAISKPGYTAKTGNFTITNGQTTPIHACL
jgi:hypothetical protein